MVVVRHEPASPVAGTGDVVVRTAGLTKRFGPVHAVDGLDLEISRGEVFGFLGPNGAGKTTTLRMLLGLLRADAGTAQVFGIDVWERAPEVHRRIGYVPGDLALYERMTGRAFLSYFARLRGGVDRRYLDTLVERLDADLQRPIAELSKGNRQKIGLIQAVMHRPDLLVLDEPTTGLDPLVQEQFQSLVREASAAGRTVLLSSHLLPEVQRVADRVGILRAGRLVAVERLAELRAKSPHHVEVRFRAAVPEAAVLAVPGVHALTVSGTTMQCTATSAALDGLVKAVGSGDIDDIEITEADLEEMFLAFYGGADDDR